MMRVQLNYKKTLILLSAFLLVLSACFIEDSVLAQPSCEWDCMNTDCCSPGYELPCNGGTYAGICVTACVGPAHVEAPPGTCPL
jgi:hypothetical protein